MWNGLEREQLGAIKIVGAQYRCTRSSRRMGHCCTQYEYLKNISETVVFVCEYEAFIFRGQFQVGWGLLWGKGTRTIQYRAKER